MTGENFGDEPTASRSNGNGSPFFVIGSVRSGTTLVERILNRHSRLFVPPETFYFTLLDRLGLLEGDGSASDVGLQRVVERYKTDRAFGFLGVPQGQEESILLDGAASYCDILQNLMRFLSQRAAKPRWGEKTPNNLRYVPFIRKCFPNARFILVVRDGRAAVMSRLKHPNWRRNLLACARHWSDDAVVMQRLIATQDPSILHVLRFEELLSSPEKTIKEMCEFLGEPFEKAMIDAQLDNKGAKQDYYNQPWMAKSVQGIDRSRANDWRREYSARELRLVEGVAGEQLKALGYPLHNPRAPGWQILYFWEMCLDLGRKVSNISSGRRRRLAAANAVLRAE